MEQADIGPAGSDADGGGAGEAGGRVDLHPPADVQRIARRLEQSGYETWAVGGAVRDALRGEHPGDWDLATSARPGDMRRLFKRTVPIGVEHGTVGVLGKDGRLYEVTTFRRDVETFGRRARVIFADSLDEDLERRDFTINAIAWHPLRWELRDPHGGASDLASGVLRTVGDAAARFAEDRLRVLRALRFAGRFDLGIEPSTWGDLVASADKLGNLSPERIREELYKVLAGQERPSASLRLYERSGVLAALYPELQACVGVPAGDAADLWGRQMAAADAVPRSRPILRLAALLHGVGQRQAPHAEEDAVAAAAVWRLMRRLRASNADANRVAHLVAQQATLPDPDATDAELRRWVRRVGEDFYRDLFRLRIAICRAAAEPDAGRLLLAVIRRVRTLLRERPVLAIGDLAIGGAELRAAGIPPGPLYGEILRDLLERVTDDPGLNTRERLVEIVERELR
jgi:tRNA nucleotidyltransferase (CCA-adding enzyme)